MMVINFCDPVLQPRISTNAVTVDGYDVTNLCSENPTLRNKGILVESYIKPPVSIIVHFPVNILLHKVIISTAVGGQRSCGLELYTHSQRRYSTWLLDHSNGGQVQEACPSESDVSRVYCCIGRAYDEDVKYFSFVNPSYRPNTTACASLPEMPQHVFYGEAKVTELHTKHGQHLNNVSYLVIRITRAIRSSACALKWLEIWGEPSHSCKGSWICRLSELCWHKYGECSKRESESQSSVLENDKHCDLECDPNQVSELPEEFLDPLTQEMMVMPVLLPCGKSIDQSSLDHYVKELAQWGRSPNDPFTGKEFTQHDKPIPNAALKARMDQYLLQHPLVAGKVDFRVGRTTSIFMTSHVTHSNLVADGSSSTIPSSHRSCEDQMGRQMKRLHSNTSPNEGLEHIDHKAVHDNYSTKSVLKNSSGHPVSSTSSHTLQSSKRLKVCSNQLTPSVCNSSMSPAADCILESSPADSSSLDNVLKLTLANLPSFLQKPLPKCDGIDSCCVYCKKSVDVTILYMLECSHLLCKPCLLNQSDRLKCAKCHQVTNRTKIIKAHF